MYANSRTGSLAPSHLAANFGPGRWCQPGSSWLGAEPAADQADPSRPGVTLQKVWAEATATRHERPEPRDDTEVWSWAVSRGELDTVLYLFRALKQRRRDLRRRRFGLIPPPASFLATLDDCASALEVVTDTGACGSAHTGPRPLSRPCTSTPLEIDRCSPQGSGIDAPLVPMFRLSLHLTRSTHPTRVLLAYLPTYLPSYNLPSASGSGLTAI